MYSLQSRLSFWLAIMLVVIFGLHIVLMGHFSRYLAEERVITRLLHDSESLKGRLELSADGKLRLSAGPISPIYRNPGSGHYFQVKQGAHMLRSPSLGQLTLDVPDLGKKMSEVLHINGPGGEPLLVWVGRINWSGQDFIMAIAEEVADIQEDIDSQRLIYFIGTSLAVLLLIVLQRLVIRKSMEPVEQARQELLEIEEGKMNRIHQPLPDEIQPMVDELNHLLATMSKRLERSRNATGNLAHALKTPLSVLQQLSDSQEVQNDPELADELNHVTHKIHDAINRELKRARLSGAPVIGQSFALGQELPELIKVMQSVHAQKKLAFELQMPTQKSVHADREDMMEMFGNLLDNAGKWAKSTVRLRIADLPGLHFTIEDDGPGIDAAALDSVMQRGARLDETIPGHGLGLAIVAEIVEQCDGSIRFDRSEELGGLSVVVDINGL